MHNLDNNVEENYTANDDNDDDDEIHYEAAADDDVAAVCRPLLNAPQVNEVMSRRNA